MLRALALSWLFAGVCCAANAQALSLSQNSANNYALIAPGDASTDIELSQAGVNNMALTRQNGQDNWLWVDQRAKNSNTSLITQFGDVNVAVVTQQYNFRNIVGGSNGYTSQQTNYGYLSEFNSGGVSILALTGSGNTLISSFGRSH
jgi:hypothetical protein